MVGGEGLIHWWQVVPHCLTTLLDEDGNEHLVMYVAAKEPQESQDLTHVNQFLCTNVSSLSFTTLINFPTSHLRYLLLSQQKSNSSRF